MTVIYRQNWFIYILRKIPTKLRFSLTIILLISSFSFWFLTFYYPLLIKNQDTQLELQKLSTQQDVFKNTTSKFSEFEKEKNKLKSEISSLLSKQPSAGQLPIFIKTLKEFNLTCKSAEPEKSKLKKENQFHEKDYFNLSLKGEFKNFVDYFNFVKQSNNLIKFKFLDFSLNKKNKIKVLAKVRFISFKNYEKQKI